LSITEEPVLASAPAFDPEGAWRLHPQVALRDESFGALARLAASEVIDAR